jgi:hypothetical protein
MDASALHRSAGGFLNKVLAKSNNPVLYLCINTIRLTPFYDYDAFFEFIRHRKSKEALVKETGSNYNVYDSGY